MLTVEDAVAQILQVTPSGRTRQVLLQESCGRVLACDLKTPHPSPPFDKSMMDGFAVKSSGFHGAELRTLPILETVTAGQIPAQRVTADSAVRIMTGALIPEGADCVVPIERVVFDERRPESVTISPEQVSAESNVLRTGRIVGTGERLLDSGTFLQAQHIAVLAEFGIDRVTVAAQPTVAVLATGDELVACDQPLQPGRIRNSNEPMLVCQVQNAGAIAVPLGIAADRREVLAPAIQQGLQHDMLLLSGGVSAGTLDLVPSELQAAGVEEIFHGIRMKPGKPLWFGRRVADSGTCLVFGLPGNPVSSMICFEVFVRPALRRMCGISPAESVSIPATLTADVLIRGDRLTYYPCRLELTSQGLQATPVDWTGSADLRSTAQANGMCILEPRLAPWPAGSVVSAIAWSPQGQLI
ncbi:MAG: molybdopterin molybdotransferase MoeA [Planctomycetaceae bacterium]